MTLARGTRIGPYEVIGLLGAGGMGAVYRARDARLQRDVAIKVLPPAFAADAARRSRFEREAQAVAALSHPNVLAVYDVGTHEGQLFIVTELLEGETLAARLAGGRLPVRRALDYAGQIARGLAAAHDKGIVHRDLKPDNIFILRDGTVRLLDFGLARQTPRSEGATRLVEDGTEPGTVLGTVGYMAPEQVRGGAADARTDLFALGVVLYEMLSGRPAFRRDTAAETMTAILREDPPPLSADTELTPALDRIVRHCLEKEPSDRFDSARDVAFAIEALSGSGTQAPATEAPGPARRSYFLIAAVAVLVAIAGASIWWAVTRGTRDEGPPIVIGAATQITSDDGLEFDPVIAPNGTLLAYSAGHGGRLRVFIRPIAGGRVLPVSDEASGAEFQPRWSPDSSRILYLTESGAYIASALGGASRRIAAGPIGSAAWAPDGRSVAIVRGDDLLAVSLDGSGGERAIARGESLHSCAWAPTGAWIACAAGNGGAIRPGLSFGNIAPSAIALVPAAGGEFRDLTDRLSMNQSPVWSADGSELYIVSNRQGTADIYRIRISPDGAAGTPHRVSTGLGVHSISLAADGSRLAYASYSSRANIWSMPIPAGGRVDTGSAKPVTSGSQTIEAMSLTPDREWLVYDSTLHGNAELFRVRLDGGQPERLTDHPSHDFAPDLSPSGRDLAFHSYRGTSRDIFLQPIEGGAAKPVTATDGHESYPAWSPDGRSLLYVDQRVDGGQMRGLYLLSGGPDLWREPVQLKRGVSSQKPAWAEGGRSVLYAVGGAVELLDLESRAIRVLHRAPPEGPSPGSVALSEDGRTVYFKSHFPDRRASFWSVPLAGGPVRQLIEVAGEHLSIRRDFAVGRGRFFFTLEDRQADIWIAQIDRDRD